MLVAHCKALEARGPIASHIAGPPGPAALLLALEGRASVAVARRLPALRQHPHEPGTAHSGSVSTYTATERGHSAARVPQNRPETPALLEDLVKHH